MISEPLARARAHLGEVVDRARHGNQPTILTDHGKPAAVVISHEAYEHYQRLQQAEDQRRVRQALTDETPGRSFDNFEDMMREAGLT